MTNTVNQIFRLQNKALNAFQLAPTLVDVALDKVPLASITVNDPKDLCIEMQNIISLSSGVLVTAARFLVPDKDTYLSNPDGTTRLRGTIIVSITHNKIKKLNTSILIFSAKVKVLKLWQVTTATLCKNCFEYGHHTINCNNKVHCNKCADEHSMMDHRCNNINYEGYKTFKRKCCQLDSIMTVCVSCGQLHFSSDSKCPVRATKNTLAQQTAKARQMKRESFPKP